MKNKKQIICNVTYYINFLYTWTNVHRSSLIRESTFVQFLITTGTCSCTKHPRCVENLFELVPTTWPLPLCQSSKHELWLETYPFNLFGPRVFFDILAFTLDDSGIAWISGDGVRGELDPSVDILTLIDLLHFWKNCSCTLRFSFLWKFLATFII